MLVYLYLWNFQIQIFVEKLKKKLSRNIIGFDINKKRIQDLKQNIDLTAEVSKEDLDIYK